MAKHFHKIAWTWVEVRRQPYNDRGKAMVMILEKCNVCGKQRFRKERA